MENAQTKTKRQRQWLKEQWQKNGVIYRVNPNDNNQP